MASQTAPSFGFQPSLIPHIKRDCEKKTIFQSSWSSHPQKRRHLLSNNICRENTSELVYRKEKGKKKNGLDALQSRWHLTGFRAPTAPSPSAHVFRSVWGIWLSDPKVGENLKKKNLPSQPPFRDRCQPTWCHSHRTCRLPDRKQNCAKEWCMNSHMFCIFSCAWLFNTQTMEVGPTTGIIYPVKKGGLHINFRYLLARPPLRSQLLAQCRLLELVTSSWLVVSSCVYCTICKIWANGQPHNLETDP